jgi:hypothetical protein
LAFLCIYRVLKNGVVSKSKEYVSVEKSR